MHRFLYVKWHTPIYRNRLINKQFTGTSHQVGINYVFGTSVGRLDTLVRRGWWGWVECCFIDIDIQICIALLVLGWMRWVLGISTVRQYVLLCVVPCTCMMPAFWAPACVWIIRTSLSESGWAVSHAWTALGQCPVWNVRGVSGGWVSGRRHADVVFYSSIFRVRFDWRVKQPGGGISFLCIRV